MSPLIILCISSQLASKFTFTRSNAFTVFTSKEFLSFVHWTVAKEKMRSMKALETGICKSNSNMHMKTYRKKSADNPVQIFVGFFRTFSLENAIPFLLNCFLLEFFDRNFRQNPVQFGNLVVEIIRYFIFWPDLLCEFNNFCVVQLHLFKPDPLDISRHKLDLKPSVNIIQNNLVKILENKIIKKVKLRKNLFPIQAKVASMQNVHRKMAFHYFQLHSNGHQFLFENRPLFSVNRAIPNYFSIISNIRIFKILNLQFQNRFIKSLENILQKVTNRLGIVRIEEFSQNARFCWWIEQLL